MIGENSVVRTHSGMGISSFIISTATGVLMFLTFVVAGVMETTTPGGIDENSPGAMVVGMFLLAFILLDLIAIGLGITGLLQPGRKKVFSALGVIFGAATVGITIFAIILGSLA